MLEGDEKAPQDQQPQEQEGLSSCPRCSSTSAGMTINIDNTTIQGAQTSHQKCPKCGQFMRRNDANDKVLWRLHDDGENSAYFSPYRYARSLIVVPGMSHKVTMNRRINQEVCDYIRKWFVPRDSDVWLATYPKSGTTWVQNILSHLLFEEPNTSNGIGVGLTYDENVVWFEAQCTNAEVKEVILNTNNKTKDDTPTITSPVVIDITESSRSNLDRVNSLYNNASADTPIMKRRCFKSHSPLGILEPLLTANGKVIHVVRNPKDTAVSLWHHSRTKDFGYEGPFPHFLEEMFMPGQVESGSWWEYVIPYWLASYSQYDAEPYSNVLTIWYEDLISSPESTILKMAEFLDVMVTPERIAGICIACSFDAMKSAQSTGGVVLRERTIIGNGCTGNVDSPNANQIRKGGIGGWETYFSREQSKKFDVFHRAEVDRCFAEFDHYARSVGSCPSTKAFYESIQFEASS